MITELRSLIRRELFRFDPSQYYRAGTAKGSEPPSPELKAQHYDLTLISDEYYDVDRFTHLFRYHVARALFPRGRVLDVGCGLGYGSAIVGLNGGAMVTGVDVSSAAIEYAQANWRDRARYVRASALELPFRDATFSGAMCFELYEHISDQRRLLKEIRRVLRPDSRVVLSTPNLHHLLTRIKGLLTLQKLPEPGASSTNIYHVREVPFGLFLSEVGAIFQIDACVGLHLPLRRVFRLLESAPILGMRRGSRLAILAAFFLPHLASTNLVIARNVAM